MPIAMHLAVKNKIPGQSGLPVEGDTLDAVEIAEQPGFHPADDPDDAGLGPGRLQASDHRHYMTAIANGR